MQELTPLDPPERELEQSLESLALATGQMQEQEMGYRAGLRTARRRVNFWRCVAAAVVVLASAIAVVRPRTVAVTVDRYVYLPHPSANAVVAQGATPTPTLPSAYLALRDAVETQGWRALAPAQAMEGPAATGQTLPPRPIDESAPGFWEITRNRG